MAAVTAFASLEGCKYLNLETFRKNGEAVRTPVWFAEDLATDLAGPAAKLYVYTIGNTGKVKRIRHNGRVRIAPCNASGKLLGEWVDAHAEIVAGEQAARGMGLLNKKYVPWKQLLDFFAMLRPRERVVMAILPA